MRYALPSSPARAASSEPSTRISNFFSAHGVVKVAHARDGLNLEDVKLAFLIDDRFIDMDSLYIRHPLVTDRRSLSLLP